MLYLVWLYNHNITFFWYQTFKTELPAPIDTLEDNETDDDDDPSDSLKTWLGRFALKTGFNYKVRNSANDHERSIYEFSRSGTYNPRLISDSTKCRNVSKTC